jgi:hypothetical protein
LQISPQWTLFVSQLGKCQIQWEWNSYLSQCQNFAISTKR